MAKMHKTDDKSCSHSGADGCRPRTDVNVIKQRVVSGCAENPESDCLAIEDPLQIEWQHPGETKARAESSVITMRTPGHDEDLVFGYLFCAGIILQTAAVESLEFGPRHGASAPTRVRVHLNTPSGQASRVAAGRVMQASCGVCGNGSLAALELPDSLRLEDDLKIPASWIHELPGRMQCGQGTFRRTGGLHAAALFSATGDLLAVREDIGRHNALDKVIGACLRSGHCPGVARLLCVSGRSSYEILQKALMARLAVIAGVGAPSSMAVALANDFNVTLIGFARSNSYNIYSCPARLIMGSNQ